MNGKETRFIKSLIRDFPFLFLPRATARIADSVTGRCGSFSPTQVRRVAVEEKDEGGVGFRLLLMVFVVTQKSPSII